MHSLCDCSTLIAWVMTIKLHSLGLDLASVCDVALDESTADDDECECFSVRSLIDERPSLKVMIQSADVEYVRDQMKNLKYFNNFFKSRHILKFMEIIISPCK